MDPSGLEAMISGDSYLSTESAKEIITFIKGAKPHSIKEIVIRAHGGSRGCGLNARDVNYTQGIREFGEKKLFLFSEEDDVEVDLQELLKDKLAPDAKFVFKSCNSATGEMNISRTFSKLFPGSTATGSNGIFYAFDAPLIPVIDLWPENGWKTYKNGKVVPPVTKPSQSKPYVPAPTYNRDYRTRLE